MTIYICGDSTAASYAPERGPITGWGQVLGELIPGVTVVNRAMAGRSTKSFLSEGRLTEVEKLLQPGDLLLIQFTHNDASNLVWRHTDPHTSFTANLSIFVDTARIHGAAPVLMTPIPRCCWKDGELLDMHGAYPEAIRRLATIRGTALLDICEEGMKSLREMDEEASQLLYMNVAPGLYPAYPNGSRDDTHTQRAGAELYARIAAEQLKKHHLI